MFTGQVCSHVAYLKLMQLAIISKAQGIEGEVKTPVVIQKI
jgi:hypothetical protein